jgi:hypothetical protein
MTHSARMEDGWVCGSCHSINRPRDKRCYSCHQERGATEDVRPRADRPSDTPAAVRISLPEGMPAGASAWTVSPGTSPQAGLEAVMTAAAKEMERIDPASVKAWNSLAADDQLWLAGSFILVGLAVAMADGRIEPGEIERAFLKIDEINATTRSYVVTWATAILSDRSLMETVLSTAFGSPSPDRAFARSRAALEKLPEPDRCRMAAALYSNALDVITAKNGSPPTPDTIELRQLLATIARLGLDLAKSVEWVLKNGR